jgi:restriction system protein
MNVGDIVIYPSKADRMVNIGIIASDYLFAATPDLEYPNRRHVTWKIHAPRAQFSQAALYEIGSALTLFQVTNNADEFLAALNGSPLAPAEVDAVAATEIAIQTEESVEDFTIKRLKGGITSAQFEQFVAGLLRCMGYYARVTQYSKDGGIDIIAHKDELGFEPPIVKVQCKQTLSTIGGPNVQQLLGAIQPGEFALFITLGDYSTDAKKIESNKSNVRLIRGIDLVQLIFNNYESLEPQFKAMLPLRQSYAPSAMPSDLGPKSAA